MARDSAITDPDRSGDHWFDTVDEAIWWLKPYRPSTTFGNDEKDAFCDVALMLADEVMLLRSQLIP